MSSGAPAGQTSLAAAPPNTRVASDKISSKHHSATFRFKATGDATRFQCALVRKPSRESAKTPRPKYSKCGSPMTFTHLNGGTYIFYVRAAGPGGLDNSPATRKFKIT
jgi:hypothetical protein